MDAQCGETSFYVFSACIYCTAGLITVGSLSFCCKLLNKNYFQKKKKIVLLFSCVEQVIRGGGVFLADDDCKML